jgi:hypothetical protein
MAFATITAGSIVLKEPRIDVDAEYVEILHIRLYVSLPSSESLYFPSFCTNNWLKAFK